MFTRSEIVKVLYRLAALYGFLAMISAVVFLYSPKERPAVLAELSAYGVTIALVLCAVLCGAGYVVKMQLFTRSNVAKILYRLSIFFGGVAIICGLVYWDAPKGNIAVVALVSMFGGIGSVILCIVLGVAGYFVKSWKPPGF